MIPPALFLAAVALRRRPLAQWVKLAWNAEIRLWHVAIAGVAAVAVGFVLVRRGTHGLLQRLHTRTTQPKGA